MRTVLTSLAFSIAAAFTLHAAPSNTTCPVGGRPVKPGFVATYKGKEYALCCNKCKAKFEAEPEKYAK